jgi:hypothetical protein
LNFQGPSPTLEIPPNIHYIVTNLPFSRLLFVDVRRCTQIIELYFTFVRCDLYRNGPVIIHIKFDYVETKVNSTNASSLMTRSSMSKSIIQMICSYSGTAISSCHDRLPVIICLGYCLIMRRRLQLNVSNLVSGFNND